MGLDIYGKKTGHHLGGSYSKLHNCTRYLSLVYCGMPDTLGKRNQNEEQDTFQFYMHPWVYGKDLSVEKMQWLFFAIQRSGLYFPNINMHSDAEGNYTKRGKIDGHNLETGNSKDLLKELEILCNDKDLNELCITSERIKYAMEYTIKFRDLVKDELENGCGVIEFH